MEVPRGLRIARLALLPLVVVLAAVLLLGRGDAAGKTVTTKLGVTTQGREFRLGLDSDGRVSRFSTALSARHDDRPALGPGRRRPGRLRARRRPPARARGGRRLEARARRPPPWGT